MIPNLKFSMSDTHMIVKPGGWSREMHTHQQSEWGFVLSGGVRITAIDEAGRDFAADCGPGEGWIFPANSAPTTDIVNFFFIII